MSDKQYLEAVKNLTDYMRGDNDLSGSMILNKVVSTINKETERRLLALKAQEDNIKSDHWEEKKMSKKLVIVYENSNLVFEGESAAKAESAMFDAAKRGREWFSFIAPPESDPVIGERAYRINTRNYLYYYTEQS